MLTYGVLEAEAVILAVGLKVLQEEEEVMLQEQLL
jgi:hypothetical protein